MPYRIEWQSNGVIVSFSEIVTADEVIEVNNYLYGDPRFDDLKYQVFDFLKIKKAIVTKSDVQDIGILDKNSTIWNNNI